MAAGENQKLKMLYLVKIFSEETDETHAITLQEIIDKLYKRGISTILSTPSGARPKWMADKYPEVLRVDETRHRALFGFRHNHCYTSPVYREKIHIINKKIIISS